MVTSIHAHNSTLLFHQICTYNMHSYLVMVCTVSEPPRVATAVVATASPGKRARGKHALITVAR